MNEFEYYNFFKNSKDYILEAKEGIKGNKGLSLLINFLYFIIKIVFFYSFTLLIITLINISNPEFNFILNLIISLSLIFITILTYGPLRISVCRNAINMVENINIKKELFYGFKIFGKSVWFGICSFFAYLLNFILLIIPFFNKYINNQFTGYILAEKAEVKVGEAMKLSKKYITGFKRKYINLTCNFIKKFILVIITGYIYSLWVRPLFNSSVYSLYKDLKS